MQPTKVGQAYIVKENGHYFCGNMDYSDSFTLEQGDIVVYTGLTTTGEETYPGYVPI
jgi:hypothetical protein